jgi:outer membrane protease
MDGMEILMQTTWSMCLRHSLRVALAWAFFPLGALAEAVPDAALSLQPRPTRTHFALSLGHLQASAHEVVFGGASNDGEWSHLIWDTEHALTVDAGIRHEWGPRLSLHAEFSTALVDEGHMVDYDWLGSTPQWTDRSIHPDTSLDAYYRLDVGASWAFFKGERFSLAALTGFRYIDISWTARGGSYVYSTDPSFGLFRDDEGDFPKGEKGISYRQKIPGFYSGPDWKWNAGKLAVTTSAIVGVTVGATDRDRHWNRNVLFDESFDPQIFFGIQAGMSYALTSTLRLFADARYDHYELMKGTMRVTDLSSHRVETIPGDAAGASFGSWQFRTGLELRF